MPSAIVGALAPAAAKLKAAAPISVLTREFIVSSSLYLE
jgi:hypothetical protein